MHDVPMTLPAPRMLNFTPGRARLHLPAWSGNDAHELEQRLRSLEGVYEARANSRTGNVLLRFDRSVSTDQLLSQLSALEAIRYGEPAGADLSASRTESGKGVVGRAVVGGALGHAAVDSVFYTVSATASAMGWAWFAPVAAAHLVLDVFVWGVALHPVARHFRALDRDPGMIKKLGQLPMAPGLPRRRWMLGAALIGLLALSAAGLVWMAPELDAVMPDTVAPAKPDTLPFGIQMPSPTGSLDEILRHPDVIPSHSHPLLDRPAPNFELADSDGQTCSLEELRADGPLVLIFYYGYHCDHCVSQLFFVNRDLPLFGELGAKVVAVSADPPELTRQRFQEYGRFGFPVLSDPANKVAHAYQVFRPALDGTNAARLVHGTFLIDRDGMVRWVNVGDAPFRRNSALLYQLAKMEGKDSR